MSYSFAARYAKMLTTMREFDRRAREALGVSAAAQGVLDALRDGHAVSEHDLRRHTAHPAWTLSRMLREASAAGYVETATAVHDRRAQDVRITPLGAEALAWLDENAPRSLPLNSDGWRRVNDVARANNLAENDTCVLLALGEHAAPSPLAPPATSSPSPTPALTPAALARTTALPYSSVTAALARLTARGLLAAAPAPAPAPAATTTLTPAALTLISALRAAYSNKTARQPANPR